MGQLLDMVLDSKYGLPDKIRDFCSTIPGYLEAKEEYDAVVQQIAALSGFELYDRFERCLFRYSEYEVNAYYLFGLGLRQEILDGIKDQL